MELREILNRAEGLVINAKSFQAAGNVAEVQSRLLKLKSFLNKELVNQPAEQPAAEQPAAEPAKQASADHVSAEQAEKDEAEAAAVPESKPGAELAAEQPTEITHVEKTHEEQEVTITPTPEQPESKDGAGVVGGAAEPAAELESKPGAGIVSKPEKSQNKEGSGIT